MLSRLRSVQARLMPHGPLDVIRQLLLFAGAYYGYRLVRGAVESQAAAAFQHARNLIDIERSLHVFVEPSVQAWVSGSSFIVDAASWIYLNAQTSVTVTALIWIYLFRNDAFYFVRNMMVIGMAIALVGYIVFPTAPPRFFPEWGFSDSIADVTGVPSDSVAVNTFFNPYAAVPSMHVAFALMIGWPLARLVNWRAAKVFWATYPVLVTFVIVVTGNHFIADAVLGASTAGLSAYAARWMGRARPKAWTFSARQTAH